MAKADIVAQAVSDIQSGVVQVLSDKIGAAIDQAVAELPAPAPAGFTQADIDAAVAAVKADLQAKLDAITAKEQAEEAIVAQIKAILAG